MRAKREPRHASARTAAGEQEIEIMTGRHRDTVTPLTAVTGIAGVLFGIIVGYMLGVSRNEVGPSPSS